MKKILLLTFVFAASAFAKENEYKVPNEWLENHSSITEPDPKFTASVDKIFQANLSPLQMAETQNKWGLRGFMFDLGVSAKGVLGMLVAKGAASATVVWTKKASNIQPAAFEPSFDESVAIEDGDFTRSLEPLVQSLVKTGRVKDPVTLRKNLNLLAEDMETLSMGVRGLHTRSWEISRLRLDVSVSTEGKIGPFVSVGGGVKVRLEWFPQAKALLYKPEQTPRLAAMQSSVNDTIRNLLLVMESYDQSEILKQNRLELSGLRVGLGISTKWKAVVLKSTAAATVYAYLSRPSLKTMSMGIPALRGESKGFEMMDGEGPTEKISRIDPKRFEKGLGRATRIGVFFANRSRKSLEKSSWELNQLKTGFEIGVGGDIHLVTVNGSISGEMTFKPVAN